MIEFALPRSRRLWRHLAALAVVPLLTSGSALAETVTVMVGGGSYADAQIEAYVKPFEAETGIDVKIVRDQIQLPKLKLMVENDNVDVDVFLMTRGDAIIAAEQGYLETIDYSIYDPDELAGIPADLRQPWGVGGIYYAYVMGLNTDVLNNPQARPATWAEFWDTEEFPGTRTLMSGAYGVEGPWEFALLADGVAKEDLYPLDIDRVFASLDKIKPHVRKWWLSGSEVYQLFQGGMAMGSSYDGRLSTLRNENFPVAINYTGGKITWDPLSIPKNAPNPEAAQKYIEFATRGKQQAEFVKRTGYGPTNQNAFDHLDPDFAATLTSHPDHLAEMFVLDSAWYAETDAEGKTNAQRLIDRWNTWVLE